MREPSLLAGERKGLPPPPRWEVWAAFAFGAGIMTFVLSGSMAPAGIDDYYHLKMAAMLPEMGFTKSFPWIKWSIWNTGFVSHHHGFHVMLLPFVKASEWLTGDAQLGGKIFVILFMGVNAAVLMMILQRLEVPLRPLWILLITILPWHFFLRMSFIRVPAVALTLLLLTALLIIQRREVWVGLVAAAACHLYGGFFFVPLAAGGFVSAALACGEFNRRHVRLILSIVAGVIIGFLTHPYFPQNIKFLMVQIFETGLNPKVSVGKEWQSMDSWDLALMIAGVATVFVAALLIRLRSGVRVDATGLALLLINIGFFILYLKARRFVEYWSPFCLLSAAQLAAVRRLEPHPPPEPADDAATSHGGYWASLWRRRFIGPLGIEAIAVIVILTLVGGYATLASTRIACTSRQPLATIQGAMEYLRNNSPPGSVVFTDDWDVFPPYFYYNTHNYYVAGLDPVFTESKYPALWERYCRITQANTPTTSTVKERENGRAVERRIDVRIDDIATYFEAQYVTVDRDHAPFYRNLRARPDLFKPVWPPEASDARAPQPELTVFQVVKTQAGATGPGRRTN